MTVARIGILGLATLAFVGVSSPAAAVLEEPDYPLGVVSLTSPAGQERMRTAANCGVAAAVLANLETQESSIWCGIATLVSIFNGLRVGPGPVDEMKGVEWWTQTNVLVATGTADTFKPYVGLSLEEFAWVASKRVHATAFHADEHDVEAFRTMVKEVYVNCNDKTILSMNFDRTSVTVNASAHHSPLGTYHVDSDSMLLLDVARYKYPPLWVPLPLLHEAMNTVDSISGKKRGWVMFNATASPNLLSTPQSSSSRVVMMLLLVTTGLVAVGCLLGVCCTRLLCLRKLSTEAERELVEQGA